MLEIKVTVEIPGLMELARAIAGAAVGQAQAAQMPEQQMSAQSVPVQQPQPQPVQSAPVQQPATQQMPAQPQQYTQAPVAQSVPVQPPQQQFAAAPVPAQQPGTQAAPTTAVPTTHATQQYTQDQVAIAMTQLMDAGKIDVVTGIMQRFGVQTLMQIPKDRYPELAVILRQAGAQI